MSPTCCLGHAPYYRDPIFTAGRLSNGAAGADVAATPMLDVGYYRVQIQCWVAEGVADLTEATDLRLVLSRTAGTVDTTIAPSLGLPGADQGPARYEFILQIPARTAIRVQVGATAMTLLDVAATIVAQQVS